MELNTLETLILRAPNISYNMLLRIVNSRRLRHVDVAVSDAICGEDQAGLCRFVKSLKKCTALNTLRLRNVRFLSYSVFEILSEFRYLNEIMAGPAHDAYSAPPATWISNAGLIHLLRNGTEVEHLRFNAAELADKDNRRLTLESLVRQIQKEVPSYTAELMHGLDIDSTKVTDLLIERS
ncbi:hypothetical protein BJV82DRAFT_671907 [Fennellomyces sp. T-0311]|nr:hypothetical protein BJV82DRAFT_671907 [Fennellomyces sp. T-0311]